MAAAVPYIAMAVGAAIGIKQGEEQGEMKRKQEAQIRKNAIAKRAKATREAQKIKRRGDIMASNARAAMAASGGVASDPGAIDRLAGIGEITDYNTFAALYAGEEQATALDDAADLTRHQGKAAVQAGYMKALSTVIGGLNNQGVFSGMGDYSGAGYGMQMEYS